MLTHSEGINPSLQGFGCPWEELAPQKGAFSGGLWPIAGPEEGCRIKCTSEPSARVLAQVWGAIDMCVFPLGTLFTCV